MNRPRPGCADEPNRPDEPGPANVPRTPDIAGEETELPTAEVMVPPLTPPAFVEEQRDEVVGVQLTANRAPVVLVPSTGVLPETGAGDHAAVATDAGAALMAGGVLLLRRRQQSSH